MRDFNIEDLPENAPGREFPGIASGPRDGELRKVEPDIEVSWKPIGPPGLHNGVWGILIDKEGVVRITDGHPVILEEEGSGLAEMTEEPGGWKSG
ncbi:MAG: hypothetical protein DDT33_01754 [Firmicutes bacterium]|nr:hypothetical protein [Bacillota bacterium]